MKIITILSVFLVGYAAVNVQARQIEYVEDAYAHQASEELSAQVKKAVELFGFDKNYEVVEPKKAGIAINPWNGMAAQGINPITKNNFFILNQPWLSNVDVAAQDFIIGRLIVSSQEGLIPTSLTYINWGVMVFSILLLVCWFMLLGRIALFRSKKWLRLLAAVGVNIGVNLAIVIPLQNKISEYIVFNNECYIMDKVLEKTMNKEAAIVALKLYEVSLRELIAQGELAYEPLAERFKKFTEYVENKK